MLRVRKEWFATTILIFGFVAACDSEQKPKANAPAASEEEGEDDGKPGKKKPKPKPSPTIDDCDKTSGSSSSSSLNLDQNSEGFALSATKPSYTGEIKALIDSYCVACHREGKADGGVKLDTYANAKLKASVSNTEIKNGEMPKAGPLDSTKKALFQAWIDTGTPEKPETTSSPSATPSPSSSPGSSSSSTTDDCGKTTSTPNPVASDDEFKDIMNPPKLKECQDSGQVFDRRGAGSCHESKPIAGTCDDAAATSILGGGPAAAEVVSKNKGESYQVDQCGETSTKKYVFWVKKYKTGDTLMLDIRINSISK